MKGKDIKYENLFRLVAFKDDEQAFKELFLEFYPALCVFAMRYITQEETARDIVQDIFFQNLEKPEKHGYKYFVQKFF